MSNVADPFAPPEPGTPFVTGTPSDGSSVASFPDRGGAKTGGTAGKTNMVYTTAGAPQNAKGSQVQVSAFAGSRQSAFIFFDPQQGFRSAVAMQEEGLLDRGDATILLKVERLRPSVDARNQYNNLKGGSLRIDVEQDTPAPQSLLEQLAWTTLAGLYPDTNGKLPVAEQLSFDPGTAWGRSKAIPLPGGYGYWNWNFFLQKKEGVWGKLMEGFRKVTTQPLANAFSLPAVAATALKDLNLIMSALQPHDRTDWLFKSQKVPVAATKAAWREKPGTKLPLRTGTYVIVTEAQMHLFSGIAGTLKLEQGLIVPKSTDEFKVVAAAEQTLPDLTYLSVSVVVSQA